VLQAEARKESMEAPNSEITTARFAVLLHSCVLHIAHTYAELWSSELW